MIAIVSFFILKICLIIRLILRTNLIFISYEVYYHKSKINRCLNYSYVDDLLNFGLRMSNVYRNDKS